jgi:hypothetical protein
MGGKPQKIDALYAWIATEPDGGEGVCAVSLPSRHGIMMHPLVGADRGRIESHRADAEFLRRTTGYPIRLVRFQVREELEALP